MFFLLQKQVYYLETLLEKNKLSHIYSFPTLHLILFKALTLYIEKKKKKKLSNLGKNLIFLIIPRARILIHIESKATIQ